MKKTRGLADMVGWMKRQKKEMRVAWLTYAHCLAPCPLATVHHCPYVEERDTQHTMNELNVACTKCGRIFKGFQFLHAAF